MSLRYSSLHSYVRGRVRGGPLVGSIPLSTVIKINFLDPITTVEKSDIFGDSRV